jgi:hypothetical protein
MHFDALLGLKPGYRKWLLAQEPSRPRARISRAFSSEVDTGSREENASKQESRADRLAATISPAAGIHHGGAIREWALLGNAPDAVLASES